MIDWKVAFSSKFDTSQCLCQILQWGYQITFCSANCYHVDIHAYGVGMLDGCCKSFGLYSESAAIEEKHESSVFAAPLFLLYLGKVTLPATTASYMLTCTVIVSVLLQSVI
ncbi:hypothetical protein PIB30_039048 [Stylosanthes scabra]|uniref:Uncharacterized protein n=1 Tax=Stylosanthes scabra TaxID=79078 RepID=A0ABU6SFT3_9FABA|nr:hypothetical protein [Stylosanthes scabra]